MKRVKSDQIRSTVCQYLKRRQYMESMDAYPSCELRNCHHLKQAVLDAKVILEGSTSNAISYSSITGDVTACDHQYVKFKSWLRDTVEPHQSRLRPLLYPIFIHIYLELLSNGHKMPAHKFFCRHRPDCEPGSSEHDMLDLIIKLNSKDDILSSRKAAQYKEDRCEVVLPQETLDFLFHYLKMEDNVLLLQMFNQHIHLQVEASQRTDPVYNSINTEGSSLERSQQDGPGRQAPPSICKSEPDDQADGEAITQESLDVCLARVEDGPPSLPSIALYTLNNTHQGLCGVSVSADHTVMAACLEDSTCVLHTLTPAMFKCRSPEVDVRHVNLAQDFVEDVHKRRTPVTQRESVTLRGHCGAVYSCAFTHDARHVLTASEDATVRLWDVDTCSTRVVYRGHNYPVWSVTTSPTHTYFATTSHDRTVRLWRTDYTYPVRIFVGHVQDVHCAAFHPNSNYAATGSSDKTVRLWSLADGRAVRLMQGHRAAVHALAFSPDGLYLASAGEDRRVKVWSLSSGSLVLDLRGHAHLVYSLAFDATSSVLASGGVDGVLRLWDVRKAAADNTPIEEGASPELLAAYPLKNMALHWLSFAPSNLLYAAASQGS